MWPFGKSTADRVKEALSAQPRLQDLGLQVQEQGGTVTVTGMVPRSQYGELVKVTAQGISGVTTVDVSGLVVQEQASDVQASNVQGSDVQASSETVLPDAPSATFDSIEQEIQQAVDSSQLAKQVYSAIRSNGELANNPIDVLQSGSSIILRGAVDSEHEQRLAEQLARGTSGVTAVDISGLKVIKNVKEMTQQKDESSGDVTYTVKSGDTLSEIAQHYFGDPMRYKDIAHYNNISDPDRIEIGQVIRIPSA